MKSRFFSIEIFSVNSDWYQCSSCLKPIKDKETLVVDSQNINENYHIKCLPKKLKEEYEAERVIHILEK